LGEGRARPAGGRSHLRICRWRTAVGSRSPSASARPCCG
jgi:hypothetical protein